jgi:hypothetical protein
MVIAAHRQLHRHRRAVLWALALLALAAVALTAKAALAQAHTHGPSGMDAVVAACVTVTACVLAVATGVVAVRRVLGRPRWTLAEHAPMPARVAAPIALAESRAGPAPALLQVFRL